MKCLLKHLGQMQCAKVAYPGVCLEISFIDTLTWGTIVPQSQHLPLQPISLIPVVAAGRWRHMYIYGHR